MKKCRQKDPASSQHSFDDPGEKLYQTVKKSLSDPMDEPYLSGYSQELAEKLKKKDEKPGPYPTPLRLEAGQIWTTSPQPKNEQGIVIDSVPVGIPVLILFPNTKEKSLKNSIRVIPVSCDINFFWEGESLVLYKSSPLDYPILLEIFNERPMFAGNLEDYRGTVCDKDLKRILAVRQRYFEGEIAKPDKAYLGWKKREIELTEYLTWPVNESLWQEALQIELVPYLKAADDSGIELSEIKDHLLLKTENITVAIIQKRDRVILRFSSDDVQPGEITTDGSPAEMTTCGRDVFELVIGHADQMPPSMEITINIPGETLTFNPQFIRKKGE